MMPVRLLACCAAIGCGSVGQPLVHVSAHLSTPNANGGALSSGAVLATGTPIHVCVDTGFRRVPLGRLALAYGVDVDSPHISAKGASLIEELNRNLVPATGMGCARLTYDTPGRYTIVGSGSVEGRSSDYKISFDVEEASGWSFDWGGREAALKGEVVDLRGSAVGRSSGRPILVAPPAWAAPFKWNELGRLNEQVEVPGGLVEGMPPLRVVDAPTQVTVDAHPTSGGTLVGATLYYDGGQVEADVVTVTIRSETACTTAFEAGSSSSPPTSARRVRIRPRENASGRCRFDLDVGLGASSWSFPNVGVGETRTVEPHLSANHTPPEGGL